VRLTELIEANKDKFDYDFFLLIAGAMEEAQEAGDELRARRLAKLRAQLVALVGGPSGLMPEPLPPTATFDDLLQALQTAEPDKLIQVVAVNRPRFDYFFFQALTSQLEAAQAAGENAYIRIMGERDLAHFDRIYRDRQETLSQWAELIKGLDSQKVFVYIDNYFEGHAPATANKLKDLLNIPAVSPETLEEQPSLF
jgi:hypothetical protein